MIQVQILHSHQQTRGKEREQGSEEGKPLGVAVIFTGPHFLPFQEVPTRISRFREGQFTMVPDGRNRVKEFHMPWLNKVELSVRYSWFEQNKDHFMQFIDTTATTFAFGREIKLDHGARATVAVWPFVRSPFLFWDFIDLRKLGGHLLKYSRTTSEPYSKVSDIPGWKEVKPALDQLKKRRDKKITS